MLSLLRSALIEAGILGHDAHLDYNVTFSTGHGIVIDLCDSGRTWYHAKLSRVIDFGSEFDNCRLAHRRFQRLTPRPLAHVRAQDWSILVAESVDHTAVRPVDLADGTGATSTARDLASFFATGRAQALPHDQAPTHDSLLRELRAYFFDSVRADPHILRLLDETAAAGLAHIPYIPQHGDFTLNNLGRTKNGLIIFDWEDYGAVGLAGLDICLLALSAGGLTADAARALQTRENPLQHASTLVGRSCDASDLPRQTFRNLVPFYLLVFRFLKRNYGPVVRQRIDDILHRILT
jgi:hypothetical protein